ncbi:hypothetical protein LCGC14_2020910 [marine sediment metagenome]|uniref:Uncharacterized protein n=1 Tax=marine sediment metagenome TaxID=412755 RepID=A0A0F9FK36_9ZZZZ
MSHFSHLDILFKREIEPLRKRAQEIVKREATAKKKIEQQARKLDDIYYEALKELFA